MASSLPVFYFFLKCSVSCGTGVQVRKVECVSMAMAMAMPQQQQMANMSSTSANGQNLDYFISDNVSGNNNNDDNNERRANVDASGMLQANGNEANRNTHGQAAATVNGQHLKCDPKTKPIATQPCTTGIECSTITLGTGNIDRGRGVDATKQIERTKVDDTADKDTDDVEATNTDADASAESDIEETGETGKTDETSENGNAETGGKSNGDVDADEIEEIEVFIGTIGD